MSNTNTYIFIRIWGEQLGSHPHYIELMIEQAREDNAPWNAIYELDGKWHTVSDIDSFDRQLSLYRAAASRAHRGDQ